MWNFRSAAFALGQIDVPIQITAIEAQFVIDADNQNFHARSVAQSMNRQTQIRAPLRFSAASKAQQAADWMHARQTEASNGGMEL